MSTPYGAVMQPPPGGELRSVTPAMGNTRHQGRYPSAPRMGVTPSNPNEIYATQRSMTPNRYLGGYNRNDDTALPSPTDEQRAPSSTGLIRLTLKKPMGIVFEPMYDPNQPSLQRGVRICDLPRTGAAALSRKLQVGDELLQINDRTVSRLSFDEIMDFIIDADPESVNLLFRRPRKETLQARQGVQQKLNAAANKDAPSTVKWVDEEQSTDKPKKEKEADKRKDRKKSKRSKKEAQSEEDETIQSSVAGSESYVRGRRTKKSRSRRGPYESESFLDMLIDTICANSGNVCRDSFRKNDEYYSDEESFNSEHDESTYVTYDESVDKRDRKKKHHHHSHSKKEDTIYEEDEEDSEAHRRNRRRDKDKHDPSSPPPDRKGTYEDDGTLQTDEESNDRVKMEEPPPPPHHAPPPLGLAPPSPPAPSPTPQAAVEPQVPVQEYVEDETNPAPIKEVEYDERLDHGADVSVMESLGGPSLLIEKQRAAQVTQRGSCAPVPQEILDEFGLDFPADFGKSREETIQEDPLKYYTYVVKSLLEEHEPEKVRLLDKLLAKYKGREDHLVQKLSVRYNRPQEEEGEDDQEPEQEEVQDDVAFSDAVKKSKESLSAAAAVHTAKERMQNVPMEPEDDDHEPYSSQWPEKEQKEPEPEDEEEEERSESGSEYSGDSVDGTSPAVIAQVSELLNYVYGKTSVPGQIDRVSTIMRAYEGREAVLLELLETKALIKANKEKENADNLPAFLRNSAQIASQENPSLEEDDKLPAVTPMAQGGIHDDISSMSGVSSPAVEQGGVVQRTVNVSTSQETEEAERPSYKTSASTAASSAGNSKKDSVEGSHELLSTKSGTKPPTTPADRKKKKGIFGGLFGKRKGKDGVTSVAESRSGSRQRTRKVKGAEASI